MLSEVKEFNLIDVWERILAHVATGHEILSYLESYQLSDPYFARSEHDRRLFDSFKTDIDFYVADGFEPDTFLYSFVSIFTLDHGATLRLFLNDEFVGDLL